MKQETVTKRIAKYRAELRSLKGKRDRKSHNRKSTIYGNIKNIKLSPLRDLLRT